MDFLSEEDIASNIIEVSDEAEKLLAINNWLKLRDELVIRKLMVNKTNAKWNCKAIFEYFEQKKGIDIRGQSNYGEIWREITEDFDVIIMTEELKKQLNIKQEDYSSFGEFLNDFYQMDFGEMAEIALKSFESNLDKLSNENALVFRLY